MDTNNNLIQLLKSGEICVIPTDTVYGVVGLLESKEAVKKIYDAKKRDPNKPVGTILAGSTEQVAKLTTLKSLDLTTPYWPGPVSIILPASEEYDYAHKGEMSLAIRIPADQTLRSLLIKTGPLASSSANIQGSPPATTIDEARGYFKNNIALFVDGGDLSDRAPSKIIRIDEAGKIETVRQ